MYYAEGCLRPATDREILHHTPATFINKHHDFALKLSHLLALRRRDDEPLLGSREIGVSDFG